MDNLPHLIVEEPKRSKKATIAIIVFSLVIVLIPLGVYLATQRTQLLPQAATPTNPNSLENSLTLSSNSKQAALGGEIGVDVLVKADSDNINLVNTKIKFDPAVFQVARIATGSSTPQEYFATKWLESSFDNRQGEIILIGGVPSPGVKTEPAEKSLKFATIYLQPLRLGPASISFDGSELLRNSDNLNALKKTNNLDLNVAEGLAIVSGPKSTESSKSSVQKPSSNLTLIAPVGGEVYSYFKPITILWNSTDIEKIASLSLYINDQLFGTIASNFSNSNKYQWSPQTTLLLPYITISNTYQVEITGITKKGGQITVKSEGPFGISAKEDISYATTSANLNTAFNLTDASLLLSQFDKELNQSKVDLNMDKAVNQIDFWLLRRVLQNKGIIK